jgi:hypothetical protein
MQTLISSTSTLPLDGSLVTKALLFGDYTEGWTHAKIKWSLMELPAQSVSIALDVDDVIKGGYLQICKARPKHLQAGC